MSQTTSRLDEFKDDVLYVVSLGLNNTEIVNYLKDHGITTSESSIRRALKRWNVEKPVKVEEPAHLEIDGDEAEIVSQPSQILNAPEDLMKERGLSPDEWEVDRITINEWDSPLGHGSDEIIKLRQLKINLKRRKAWDLILPAKEPLAYVHRPTGLDYKFTEGADLIVFTGDQQAPFHNPHLHELFCEWLRYNQPDRGILIGDTIDLPDISRHPANPEWSATTQECIDAAYLLLRDYVQSSGGTNWTKLGGNHDERLRRVIINQISDFYGLRQAEVPDSPGDSPSVLDVDFLLRLDELGIQYIKPNGSYEHGQVNVSKHLAARHGWIARKGSGASALATLEHLGFSIVVGHTHRQSQVHKTRHDIDGNLETITAVETGCMCRIEEGLGYAVAPDWQNGFATAIVWPDGTFRLELATYVNSTLFWRDQRYQ